MAEPPNIIERFAEGLASVLSPHGFGLALFTTDGDQKGFVRALEDSLLDTEIVADRHLGNEIVSVYLLRPPWLNNGGKSTHMTARSGDLDQGSPFCG